MTQWNAERLRRTLATFYGGDEIVVLANREPFRHDLDDSGNIVVRRSAGGLVTALEPVIRASSGVWVAHGSGTADRIMVDERDGLDVPPAKPQYRLRRVWLDRDEERHYYDGFANEGLWPLCHRAHVRPVFRLDDFEAYRSVNGRFAEAVCDEVHTDRPLVLVQDYHFALAPQMIRNRMPLSTIIAFWHIPWPNPHDYAICPWGHRLLRGLLASTIVGFQTQDNCGNFLDTVECTLDAQIDRRRGAVIADGHSTIVRAYPVSIEWRNRWVRRSPAVEVCRAAIRRQLGLPADIRLGIGIDRLDYTKGVDEKFLAVERLLDLHPKLRERFVFVQIAEPSRVCLPAYRELRSRISGTADRVNRRFGTDGYRPIVLLETHHEPADVYRFLRAADVCYVGSIHDGMNLVAKEFVCARDDGRGVLILSQFAGAARQLTAALIVNPYEVDACAQTLARALDMSDDEQSSRMDAMRSIVAHSDTYRWAGRMLADAARLRKSRPTTVSHQVRSWLPETGTASPMTQAVTDFLPYCAK